MPLLTGSKLSHRIGSAVAVYWMAAMLLCGTAVDGWAQQAGAKKSTAPQNTTIQTKDGVTLHITYFPSTAGANAPVAILLHGMGDNRLVWQAGAGQTPSFASALQQNEFAVICVDLRHHGENIPATASGKSSAVNLVPRDYQAMVAMDLDAVKAFIFEEHQKRMLNMNKLAIVAADFSTSIALMFAEIDWAKEPYDDAPTLALRTPRGQDVRALVLISPESRVPGLNTNTAVARIRTLKMPVMVAVGKKDTKDKGAAKKLVDLLMPKQEEKPHVTFLQLDSNARGVDLLNKGTGLEPQMYKFLDENVKKTPGEWRDRKSPLKD